MKHKDPFLGEIELKKLGEISRHAMGESVVDTIYLDERGNYYIDTWSTAGYKQPMIFLRKTLIDKINELSKQLQKQALRKTDVSRSVFLIPVAWFKKMFCKHKNKTEIFRCYQDRYISEVCNDCGKVIYSDL